MAAGSVFYENDRGRSNAVSVAASEPMFAARGQEQMGITAHNAQKPMEGDHFCLNSWQ
jgi:hypothetical protein